MAHSKVAKLNIVEGAIIVEEYMLGSTVTVLSHTRFGNILPYRTMKIVAVTIRAKPMFVGSINGHNVSCEVIVSLITDDYKTLEFTVQEMLEGISYYKRAQEIQEGVDAYSRGEKLNSREWSDCRARGWQLEHAIRGFGEVELVMQYG